MAERRDRAGIYAEILRRVKQGPADGLRLTRVQQDVNVPFVRFKDYIEDLERRQLLEVQPALRVTPAGERYLRDYAQVRAFLERFGFVGADGTGSVESRER